MKIIFNQKKLQALLLTDSETFRKFVIKFSEKIS